MCRKKPGPRCHGHAATSHAAALRRLEKAQAAHTAAQNAEGGSTAKVERTRRRLAAAVANADRATVNLDATATQQRKLADALASDGPSQQRRQQLQRRRVAGATLRTSRLAQQRLMPDPPEHPSSAASAAYDQLGKHREQLSYLDAEYAAADAAEEQQRLRRRREVLEADVFGQETNYRVLSAGRAPNMGFLGRRERAALASASPEVRADAAYVSHLRATAASGAHPPRFDEYVTRRGEQLGSRLFPAGDGPPAAAPAAKQREEGAWDTATMVRDLLADSRPGDNVDKLLGKVEDFFDVDPTRYTGQPVSWLPDDVSSG